MRTWMLAACVVGAVVGRFGAAEPNPAGGGQAALAAAAKARKFLLVVFRKDDDPAARALRQTAAAFAAAHADHAGWVEVRTDDPAEKELVDQFGAARLPLPLVLVVAPNGAVSGCFPLQAAEARLAQALVSPGMATCLKALQSRKLVFLCVQPAGAALPAGVREVLADPEYQPHAELVRLTVDDPTESAALRQFQLAPRPGETATLLLAPPGRVLGRFDGDVTKAQVLDRLKAAAAGC